MPTETNSDPQRELLDTVRRSQAAVIDAIRTWTTATEELTRTFRLPVPDVDLDALVDRAFDVAEQTLTVQRHLARTLVGAVTYQVDTAVETVDTAVAAVDTSTGERVREIVEATEQVRERPEQPQGPTEDTPAAPSAKQDRRPDGRTYEERTVEELRERAGELQIEGRSAMSKDELITALRDHRKSRSGKTDAPKDQSAGQERRPDRRTYEERTVEELRERAGELQIEGRSAMSKDELITALREQAR